MACGMRDAGYRKAGVCAYRCNRAPIYYLVYSVYNVIKRKYLIVFNEIISELLNILLSGIITNIVIVILFPI